MESASPGVERSTHHVTRLADLPPKRRRRLLLRACIGPLATSALLTVAYFALPYDHLSNAGSIVALCAGLLGVIALLAWEVRAVIRSMYPGIQAVRAIALAIPLFLLLFSTGYYLMGHNAPADFTQHLSRLDALYFTVTTFATVGFGDITARSEGARIVVTIQMIADLALIGVGIKVLFQAVEMGRQRRPSTDERESG